MLANQGCLSKVRWRMDHTSGCAEAEIPYPADPAPPIPSVDDLAWFMAGPIEKGGPVRTPDAPIAGRPWFSPQPVNLPRSQNSFPARGKDVGIPLGTDPPAAEMLGSFFS